MTLCERCGQREAWATHHKDGDSSNDDPNNLLNLCGYCHATLEDREPHFSRIRLLYETFKDIQKVRETIEGRVKNYQEQWNLSLGPLENYLQVIESVEKKAKAGLEKETRHYEIFNKWLASIRGIAETSAGQLIALIGDIGRFDSISSLWSYAGLNVKDGKAPSRERGSQISYDPRLKGLSLGIIGENFIRQNSPYRKFYDEKKEYYEKNRDWTRNHCHRAAIRYMVKQFLKHLWLKWRKLEGLRTSEPHPEDGYADSEWLDG